MLLLGNIISQLLDTIVIMHSFYADGKDLTDNTKDN